MITLMTVRPRGPRNLESTSTEMCFFRATAIADPMRPTQSTLVRANMVSHLKDRFPGSLRRITWRNVSTRMRATSPKSVYSSVRPIQESAASYQRRFFTGGSCVWGYLARYFARSERTLARSFFE